MKNKLLVTLLASVLLVSGCTEKAATTAAEGVIVSTTMKIGLMPDFASIPFIIGRDKGYFKENGIDVELEIFKSAQDRDFALQAGTIDATSADMISLMLFKESKFPIYSIGESDGRYALSLSKDLNVTSIKEFTGGKIGLSFNTLMEYLLDRVIEKNGLPEGAVEKVSVPAIPLRLELLNNGQIDGAALPEPLGTSASQQLSSVVSLLESDDDKPSVFLVTGDYLEKNPNLVSAFVKAYDKTADYLNSVDQSEYIKKVTEELSFPEGAEKYSMKPFANLKETSEAEFNRVQEWASKKELIKGSYEYKELTKR